MNRDETENPNASGGKGKDGEIVVFMIRQETKCEECGRELHPGNLLRLEAKRALCLACADLDHLEFLPSGDTALTRRASKYTKLRAVVVRWARARNRYERQGILAESDAIARAAVECEGDSEVRKMRRAAAAVQRVAEDKDFVERFYGEIRSLYPGCPESEARNIALHACQKYSGRVGRSAAAKEFDPDAIRLAVVAHIRHEHTQYDRLMNMGIGRREARAAITGDIEKVFAKWRPPADRLGPDI